MSDQFALAISAANDLVAERAALGRALPEIPVTLGWRLYQSPLGGEPADLAAVAGADLYFLLLGGDIRAPVGLEWLAAQRAGRATLPFRKQGATPTPAATVFAREVARHQPWRPFRDPLDLRRQVLRLIGDQLLTHALHFALRPAELSALRDWHATLDRATAAPTDASETGASAVILTPERFSPGEGALVGGGEAGSLR